MRKPKEIQTKRLVMRQYTELDCETMKKILCNETIKRTFMIPDFDSEEEVIKFFYRMKEMSSSEDNFVYGIYLSDRLIGFINDVERNGRSIELGYVICPDMQNQGYATEILDASIKNLFQMGYYTVRTGLFEENIASRRVMEKCGMILVEQTDEIEYQGQIHHCIYFEKTIGK